jgi:hypothetical protein
MASQFFTAVGAFVGTFLGIWIAESAGAGTAALDKGMDLAAVVAGRGAGFLGTSVQPSDLVIPATAGGEYMRHFSLYWRWADLDLVLEGFLYIASVSVIPELLEESRSMKQAIKEVRPFCRSLPLRLLDRQPLLPAVHLHAVWCAGHGPACLERVIVYRRALAADLQQHG